MRAGSFVHYGVLLLVLVVVSHGYLSLIQDLIPELCKDTHSETNWQTRPFSFADDVPDHALKPSPSESDIEVGTPSTRNFIWDEKERGCRTDRSRYVQYSCYYSCYCINSLHSC